FISQDLPVNDIDRIIHSTTNVDDVKTQLRQFGNTAIENRSAKIVSEMPNVAKTHPDAYSLGTNFLRANELIIGKDYRVIAVEENSGPTLRVQMMTNQEPFGVKQFLELRHGCLITSASPPLASSSHRCLIKNCAKSIIVLRAFEFYENPTEQPIGKDIPSEAIQNPVKFNIHQSSSSYPPRQRSTSSYDGVRTKSSCKYSQPTV
ncbi:hypothetical protein PMAYCL1PPCAC_00686, partial [Pristionchus mayeri]